ncbi:POK7 protein, partial [Cisticola juncidis]|nr:POK7 protein [Cisticola juncidis]
QAKLSHAFFHQNAQALVQMFYISKSQPKAIINTFINCQLVLPPVSTGAANPRGLQHLQLQHTGITKDPSFGKFKINHVSVHVSSGAGFASVHTGEMANHDCQHFLRAFVSLAVPQEVKTDNDPAYKAQKLATFLMNWGVRQGFGIPYSPT